jgi:hypothetical protein
MRSCKTRKLHVSRAIAIPGYAAQVSVRAGSVIAHLASLNRDGPRSPLAYWSNAALQFPRNVGDNGVQHSGAPKAAL